MIDQKIRIKIRHEIVKTLSNVDLAGPQEKKSDGSWVTAVDHLLTERVEKILHEHHPGVKLVSEEGSHDLSFPCFILDPVDGTAGLVHGTGECSLSLAFMPTPRIEDAQACGYIAHLFSDFEVDSENAALSIGPVGHGMVSRSEWNRGLFNNLSSALEPMGSIALKLAYMAAYKTDFVITKRPKSIWDIAAGTILLNRQQRYLWDLENRIECLDQLVLPGPLLWASQEQIIGLRKEIP